MRPAFNHIKTALISGAAFVALAAPAFAGGYGYDYGYQPSYG